MSRYRGPRLRLQRRLGIPLIYLTRKWTKKRTLPGQHGRIGKKVRKSEFRMRLEEKQKLKCNYSITENQLFNYVKKARKIKGSTGLIILQLLEMRLDTVVFRLNFTSTILAARQLVSNGHVKVNNKVVTVPSFQCRPEDIIQLISIRSIRSFIKKIKNSKRKINIPNHLIRDIKELRGKVKNYADRRDIRLKVNELLVVEYYARR